MSEPGKVGFKKNVTVSPARPEGAPDVSMHPESAGPESSQLDLPVTLDGSRELELTLERETLDHE